MREVEKLNADGQPCFDGYNRARNKDKALNTLMGLLKGVCADHRVQPDEFLYLNTWLKNNPLLHGDPDIYDLMDLSDDILRDGKITDEELVDFFTLSQDIIDYRPKVSKTIADELNELLGLLAGITADEELQDLEIDTLKLWFEDHAEVSWEWPASQVKTLIEEILLDGVITEHERAHLCDLVMRVCGQDFRETGAAGESSMKLFDVLESPICFQERVFCLTGKFTIGPRNQLEESIIKQGGLIKSRVTKDLHYLVVGELGSRDWRFTSLGRKIESAMKLRSQGADIALIPEDSLLRISSLNG